MSEEEFLMYKVYIFKLCDFMYKRGLLKKPFPKIVFKSAFHNNNVFAPTANYDPEHLIVNLYYKGRFIKDCLRSLCHEFVHHNQNLDGRLGEGAYSGTEITQDKKLQKLEAEAYLKGNMIFRSWTEIEKKKQH